MYPCSSQSFLNKSSAGVSCRSITLTSKSNCLTYIVASSLVCTSLVVITVVGLLDVLMVSNSAELRSFSLTIRILVPESTTNSFLSALLLRHLGEPTFRSHFGSSHVCSNFYLLVRKKSDLGSFLLHLCQPSCGTQRMEHDSSARGVGASCARATAQVCSVATSTEAPATTSARSDATAGPLAPAAPQWSPGQPQAPKTGIRAPHPDEKAAAAQERASKLEVALTAVGDDDNTAPNLREALKRARQQAVPLSTQDKVAQCESFLERAKKREAAARELVLEAQTELARLSAEVVEGEQRLATLRAELDAVDMSAEVQRLRALVEQLSKEKEMSVSKPTRIPIGCVVGKISFHNATRRCKSGSRANTGICKRPLWPSSSQKWRGYPNYCPLQRRSDIRSSKNNLQRCLLQWRIW